ncbi:MAG: universal stress protein [Candidatus Sulfotelmatobacter sp.]
MTVLELKHDTPEIKKPFGGISLKNILYATDFSATSESALPYAAALSRRFGSTLHVVHVLSDTSLLLMTGGVDQVSFEVLYEDAQTLAKGKLKRVSDGLGKIPNRSYVRHGKVWPNLSTVIAENDIDLIVIGTHGRTGLGKLLLGSVAEDILRHAPCPVLSVGPKICGRTRLEEFAGTGSDLSPLELELRHIVYATNLTAASQTVAPVAISLARQFAAQLTLIHVLENYSELENVPGPIESGVRQLQALVPKDAALAYAPEIVIECGPASDCIVNAAAKRYADLIVLGARPVDGTTHLPFSTVHRVVAHASCPVLTVPA